MRRIYELFRKAMGEDPFVRFYYQRYKRRHPKFHKYCKAASAVYALWLVFLFRLLGRDPRTCLVYPESSVCAHPSRKKMDRVLKKKDFVCFDGELLLLLRVSHIEKLWDAAGAKLGIADYKSMRRAAAAEADKKRKKGKACLAEVCKIVSEWSGADAKQLLRAEQELEEKLSYADPFYVSLISCLQREGRRVFVCCESRLASAFWDKLLRSNGISCEKVYTCAECGRLWEEIADELSGKGIFCLSSRERCIAARKAGLKAMYVQPVAQKFALYRPLQAHSLAMSVYEGIVNERLHVRGMVRSALYEHGFVYGGILAYGFCGWLEELARQRGYDCIVFLARDSELFYRIYQKYFGSVAAVYLYTSRMAALKVAVRQYFNVFLDRMFVSKAEKQNRVTIAQSLRQADLAALSEKLPAELPQGALLDRKTLPRMLEFLTNHREEIFQIYEKDAKAFGEMSSEILRGKERILLVDLGWRGTIFALLSGYWRETMPSVECEGALLGVSDCSFSRSLTDFGALKGYVYLTDRVRENHLILTELMFSSAEPTTIGYAKDEDGRNAPLFGEQENTPSAVREMGEGIEDFCLAFRQAEGCFPRPFEITGEEACAPLAIINANKTYNLNLYRTFHACLDPNGNPLSVRDILKEVGYIK